MLKLLIVDDNLLIRNEIKAMIESDSTEFEIIGEACDGEEAIEVINKNQDIDIIITDIRMPIMDGLELITNVNREKREIKFIVLSAYDDYSYVSEAFKHGAADYILKLDLSKGKVLKVLNKVKEAIYLEKDQRIKIEEKRKADIENSKKIEVLETFLSLNEQTIKEKFLRNLIWGSGEFSDIIKESIVSKLKIDLAIPNHRIMVIKIDNYSIIEKNEWSNKVELLKYGITNVLQEIADKHSIGEIFCNHAEEYIVISNIRDSRSENASIQRLYAFFGEAFNAMKFCFNTEISAGLSYTSSKLGYLENLYAQAREACEYYFILGKGRLYEYSKKDNSKEFLIPKIEEIFTSKSQLIMQVMQMSNLNEFEKNIEKLIIKAKDEYKYVAMEIKELYKKYKIYIQDFVKNHNLYNIEVRNYLDTYNSYLVYYGDLSQLNSWLKEILYIIMENITNKQSLSDKAIIYIRENYSKDISLSIIASELEVTDSYLSRVFVKETGSNFVDYLAKVRIDEAIKLMKTTNMKMKEISQIVGFKSPQQFNKTFNKVTGKNPSQM